MRTNEPRRLLVRRRRAAELLDTSVSRLKRLERRGALKAVRIAGGRDVFYALKAIERLASGGNDEGE